MERGLSQERLAFDSGIDRAYIGSLERGTQNPTVDTLDKLAELLGIAVEELFKEPSEGEAPPAPLKAGRRRA